MRIVLLTLLWVAVAGYFIFAATSVRRVRSAKVLKAVDIEVVDSSALGHMVTSEEVREWIALSGIPTVGAKVDDVDLDAIERLISGNGFVDEAVAYITYEGVLRIRVSRHKPVVRFMSGGRNCYITAEGYIFDAPPRSSLYVPVITGTYKAPCEAGFVGDIRSSIDDAIALHEQNIALMEREKYPHFHRELRNDKNIREVRRRRIKQRWWAMESDEEFEERVEALKAEKKVLLRRYRYEARLIEQDIAAIERRQLLEREAQKKLEKNYEDFMKLLTFVELVEDDDFRRAEVVQIVARTAHSGALEVDLIPRSGNHIIRFGRIEDAEEKFSRLLAFYDRGLPSIGWDAVREIDLRYDGQVVCR